MVATGGNATCFTGLNGSCERQRGAFAGFRRSGRDGGNDGMADKMKNVFELSTKMVF